VVVKSDKNQPLTHPVLYILMIINYLE